MLYGAKVFQTSGVGVFVNAGVEVSYAGSGKASAMGVPAARAQPVRISVKANAAKRQPA